MEESKPPAERGAMCRSAERQGTAKENGAPSPVWDAGLCPHKIVRQSVTL